MPAVPESIIEPIPGQASALMFGHKVDYSLGYYRVADRTRPSLVARGLCGEIAVCGMPADIAAGRRRVVKRTTAWTDVHTMLGWCTERWATVIACWIAFPASIILIGRQLQRSLAGGV